MFQMKTFHHLERIYKQHKEKVIFCKIKISFMKRIFRFLLFLIIEKEKSLCLLQHSFLVQLLLQAGFSRGSMLHLFLRPPICVTAGTRLDAGRRRRTVCQKKSSWLTMI